MYMKSIFTRFLKILNNVMKLYTSLDAPTLNLLMK
jgi:hypothetical protein